LQAKTDVPETPRTILACVRVHVRPVAGDIVSVTMTVPVKPSRLAMVIVEFPFKPEFTVIVDVLAVNEKS
jgi:hypothetical protein